MAAPPPPPPVQYDYGPPVGGGQAQGAASNQDAFLPAVGEDFAYPAPGASVMAPLVANQQYPAAAQAPAPAAAAAAMLAARGAAASRDFDAGGIGYLSADNQGQPPQAAADGAAADAGDRPEYFAGIEEMLFYFEGVTCAVVNYSPADTSAIRNELTMLGAKVQDHYSPECTHLMTPYQQGADYTAAMAESAKPNGHKPIVVSYAWLEDCLTNRRVIPHTDKVLYRPIKDEHGVQGMESCVISIAGYKGPIRNDIRELIEASGATFNQNFTKKTTHLICYRAESEIYAKALLFKLEGQPLEIVNHMWISDVVKTWRKLPEEAELYRKLGVEVDFEERLEAEKKLRMDVEAQLEEEERARRNLQELLEAEERARQEMQEMIMGEERTRSLLKEQLTDQGQNTEALAQQFLKSRGDIDSLQGLLQQSEASRAKLEETVRSMEEERRRVSLQLEDNQRQQGMLQQQFARSRQDLLTQLESRLNTIEQLRAELDAEQKTLAETNDKLEESRRQTRAQEEKTMTCEKQIKQLQEQIALEGRDKMALQKQLDAERKSRLHILSDFENERKQREHLIRQLEAEQKLRQSLQKAVSTKEELRLKAEEEIERLNQDIQEMMDEIDRLRTFEPPDKDEERTLIRVKLFLEDEVRFFEIEKDISHEELLLQVGKIFMESFILKFEDDDHHLIALKTNDDIRLALRTIEDAELAFLKLVVDKANARRGFFSRMRRKLGGNQPEEAGETKKDEDEDED